jgi:thioesterase domain-containing protein
LQIAVAMEMPTLDLRSRIIVPIQPGGEGIPLFLVHSALGSTGYYASIGREWRDGPALYGINSVGLFGGAEPLQSFEKMAAVYIDAIRQLRPRGPYAIGGHSLGAYIAFEMCLQLGESEAPICFVIDQGAPAYARLWTAISSSPDPAQAAAMMISVVAALYMKPLPATPERIRETMAALDDEAQLAQMGLWLKQLGFLPQAASTETVAAFLGVVTANCVAGAQWSPGGRMYAGRTIVIKGGESRRDPKMYDRWQDHCHAAVEQREVPGNHATILTPPGVRQLAICMSGILNRAAPIPGPPVLTADHGRSV